VGLGKHSFLYHSEGLYVCIAFSGNCIWELQIASCKLMLTMAL